MSLSKARKFFAIDASGSTEGDVMRTESEFVTGLHANPQDSITRWAVRCEKPQVVDSIGLGYFARKNQWTCPQAILKEPSAVAEILSSDIWCLLTDGEINSSNIEDFIQLASVHELLHNPVVLLFVGEKQPTPARTNISVGIPFFTRVTVGLVLFKDSITGELYVIAAKGSLAPLASSSNDSSKVDLGSWTSYPCYSNEAELMRRCEELSLWVVSSKWRQTTKESRLCLIRDSGTQALVDVYQLLVLSRIGLSDLAQLLEEESITRLAVFCKGYDRLADLRALLVRHAQQETVVRLEDFNGASRILEAMQSTKLTSDESKKLREQLREAHAKNRAAYLSLKDHPSELQLQKRNFNTLIDRGLAILSDVEQFGYTAEIFSRKSNRARRAKRVSTAAVPMLLSAVSLSESVNAFRSSCSICCGEDQIMSIVLKKSEAAEENTTNFALNFPLAVAQNERNLDMVSSQCICFQCALFCKQSIFKETLSAIIPTVDYKGSNESYINHQLTLAITAGLSTGISGIGQIFMSILDRTLETKNWCSDQSDLEDDQKDSEILIRHNALKWMLSNLLQNYGCRENFSEGGEFVDYPQALKWATADFERTELDSWVVQYPLAGFNQIVRWFDVLKLEISKSISDLMLKTKLIHLVVTSMMAKLLEDEARDRAWTHPFLQLIYQQFNTPGVPLDRGSASILGSDLFWSKLETALGQYSSVKRFLALFTSSTRQEVAQRIQIIVFWVLHYQKAHASPKTFFRTIRLQEPLAAAALAPGTKLPGTAVRDILLSIFYHPQASHETSHCQDINPPFVSPYGASVLECGQPSCTVKFYSELDPKSLDLEAVRKRRAEHLKEVYGTSVPERTFTPAPPTSTHCNLHMSIARVWSRLNRTNNSGPLVTPRVAHDPASPAAFPSKEEILSGEKKAMTEFVAEIRFEICVHNRGNIYQDLETNIRQVLPSFWRALRVASKKLELEKDGDDGSGVSFVHNWHHGSTLQAKITYELSLRE